VRWEQWESGELAPVSGVRGRKARKLARLELAAQSGLGGLHWAQVTVERLQEVARAHERPEPSTEIGRKSESKEAAGDRRARAAESVPRQAVDAARTSEHSFLPPPPERSENQSSLL
jgi:hypothetical protein